jgi:hypothetical protein
MTEDTVRDKIRKLLALANDEGAADNEAETAMRQANKLMKKHNIDLAALHQASGTKPIYKWTEGFVPTSHPKPVNQCPLWFQWVGVGIATFTDTRVVIKGIRTIKSMGLEFAGDEVDVEYAVWLAERMRDEIRIKAAMYDAPGHDSNTRWANREEFRHAMARRIRARLVELRQQRDQELKSTGTALVVVNDKIKQRDEQFGPQQFSKKRRSHTRGSYEAQHEGNQAGNQVSFGRPLGK